MSAREQLAEVIRDGVGTWRTPLEAADAILKALGQREVTTEAVYAKFDALPVGSAVQTSDTDDVVVLKCATNMFRNQDGYEIPEADLWRYGTHPFTVLYSPEVAE